MAVNGVTGLQGIVMLRQKKNFSGKKENMMEVILVNICPFNWRRICVLLRLLLEATNIFEASRKREPL